MGKIRMNAGKKLLWLTGRSGSGKTVYANYLRDIHGFLVLDGDEMRTTISSDLGFSDADKREHGRRMIELCNLLAPQTDIVVSTITAYDGWREENGRAGSGRNWVRQKLAHLSVKIVWIDATLEQCKSRDPKGIYAREPQGLAGVTSPWEDPAYYDLRIDTSLSIEKCTLSLESYLATL